MVNLCTFVALRLGPFLLGTFHLVVSQLLPDAAYRAHTSFNSRPRHHTVRAVLTVHSIAVSDDYA